MVKKIKKNIKNTDLIEFVKDLKKKYKPLEKILKKSIPSIEKNDQINALEFKMKRSINYKHLKNHCEKTYNRIKLYEFLFNNRINELELSHKIKDKKIVSFIQESPNFYLYSFTLICDIIINSIKIDLKNNEVAYTKVIHLLQQNLLKNYILDSYEVQKNIDPKFKFSDHIERIETNDNIIFNLSALTLELMHKTEMIHIYTNKKEYNVTGTSPRFIILSKEFIGYIYKTRFRIYNFPLLQPPEDRIMKDNFAIYNKNGSLLVYGKDKLIHFSKNKTQKILLSQDIIDIINSLQKQSFNINIKTLNFYVKNINNLLKKKIEFDFIKNTSLDNYITNLEHQVIINDKKLKDQISESYKKALLKAKLTIESLYIAHLYRKEDLYFSLYFDSRGRLYYTGYLMFPQGDTVARSLLKFENTSMLVGNDASASGYQILGLLFKNPLYLELTGLLNTQNLNKDFYTYFLEKFNKKYKDKIIDVRNIGIKFDPDKIIFTKNFTINPFIENRKFFKHFAIRIIYGQKQRASAKQVKEFFPNLNYYQCFGWATLIHKFILEEIPEINIFKKLSNDIIDFYKKNEIKYNAFILNRAPKILITQFYVIQLKETCTYINLKGKKENTTILKDKIPLEIDFRKNKNTLLVNFIHSIDSRINLKMLDKCIKNNIRVYSIHDSFVCSPENTDIINRFYNESVYDIMNDNLLELFLMDNMMAIKGIDNKLDEKIDVFIKKMKTIIDPIINKKDTFIFNNKPLTSEKFDKYIK